METMRKWLKRILTGVLRGAVIALVLIGSTAHAGKLDEAKRAQARQRFEAGSKFYNLREYDKALEEFKAVYLLTGEPSLLFNVGQCERQLERFVDARKSFQSYLREGTMDDQQREKVKALVAAIDQASKEAAEKDAAKLRLSQPETPSTSRVVPPLVVEAARPKRTRPWVWGVVGAGTVVVVGLAVGLGVGLGAAKRYPSPTEGSIDGN